MELHFLRRLIKAEKDNPGLVLWGGIHSFYLQRRSYISVIVQERICLGFLAAGIWSASCHHILPGLWIPLGSLTWLWCSTLVLRISFICCTLGHFGMLSFAWELTSSRFLYVKLSNSNCPFRDKRYTSSADQYIERNLETGERWLDVIHSHSEIVIHSSSVSFTLVRPLTRLSKFRMDLAPTVL